MTNFKDLRLLVTPTSFGQSSPKIWIELDDMFGEVIRNDLGRPLQGSELAAMVMDVDAIIAGLDEINAEVFENANRLKVVSRYGVGIENVDLATATSHHVVVTNTPGANSVSVAELAIGLILMCLRNICQLNKATRDGDWPRSEGISLRGKTLGLIGLGAIGMDVADRLRAFGCQLVATDPFTKTETAIAHDVKLVTLNQLLAEADIISLHAPVTPQTKEMVNREFLSKVKPGVVIINTARGQLIDENALVDALKDGRVRGAGLDAFSKEPPGADNPLFQFSQVIATPHTGAHCDDAITAMSYRAMENCITVLKGERPINVVNPDVYVVK
jgi:D-3-phosphoglycerate dehydrogenase